MSFFPRDVSACALASLGPAASVPRAGWLLCAAATAATTAAAIAQTQARSVTTRAVVTTGLAGWLAGWKPGSGTSAGRRMVGSVGLSKAVEELGAIWLAVPIVAAIAGWHGLPEAEAASATAAVGFVLLAVGARARASASQPACLSVAPRAR